MIALWLLACGGTSTATPAGPVAPQAIATAECAVCGMVVAEQPSPRGQLVYRDGSHDHVCSVEELRALAQQPSAKGRPIGVFVEVLPPTFDLASTATDPLPFKPVGEVWYVFNAPRTHIMGEPVLVFSERATATEYAETLGSQAVQWTALEQVPFHIIPDQAGVPPKP